MNLDSQEKLNEISTEDMNNVLIDNSFSDASFSINHEYGRDYNECVKRLNPLVEEKYFNVFSNVKKEKITNTISPYSQETITWATVYTRVIRKIINPFQGAQGKLFLSLEELDRHIAVVLQNRDLFKNNDTSSSEPIKGKIEINERLQKESENYIPKLIEKFSFIKKNEDDEGRSKRLKKFESLRLKKKMSTKGVSRKQSAFDLRRKNKLTTVSALNRLNLAYDNHNSQKNVIETTEEDCQRKRSCTQVSKANEAPKAVTELSFKPTETFERSKRTLQTQRFIPERQSMKRKSLISSVPSQLSSSPYSNQRGGKKGVNSGILVGSPNKERVKRRVTIVEDNNNPSSINKKFNEYRQIPYDSNYFSVNHYKPVEKMAYRDELDRYNPNKKINYGFYVTKENENTFKEMFDLINFQPITLDSNKFTQSELQKRGDRIAAYKSMSNNLINSIIKADHLK